jgi:hypothetical protein
MDKIIAKWKGGIKCDTDDVHVVLCKIDSTTIAISLQLHLPLHTICLPIPPFYKLPSYRSTFNLQQQGAQFDEMTN